MKERQMQSADRCPFCNAPLVGAICKCGVEFKEVIRTQEPGQPTQIAMPASAPLTLEEQISRYELKTAQLQASLDAAKKAGADSLNKIGQYEAERQAYQKKVAELEAGRNTNTAEVENALLKYKKLCQTPEELERAYELGRENSKKLAAYESLGMAPEEIRYALEKLNELSAKTSELGATLEDLREKRLNLEIQEQEGRHEFAKINQQTCRNYEKRIALYESQIAAAEKRHTQNIADKDNMIKNLEEKIRQQNAFSLGSPPQTERPRIQYYSKVGGLDKGVLITVPGNNRIIDAFVSGGKLYDELDMSRPIEGLPPDVVARAIEVCNAKGGKIKSESKTIGNILLSAITAMILSPIAYVYESNIGAVPAMAATMTVSGLVSYLALRRMK